VLALALMTGFSGCGGSHPELDALSTDSMATATFDHTSLAQEIKRPEGSTLGKPVHAQVLRRFSFDNVKAEDLVQAAATTAVAHGWKQRSSRQRGFSATKNIDGVPADLVITVGDYKHKTWLFVYITALS
jgi:hypothetical protein